MNTIKTEDYGERADQPYRDPPPLAALPGVGAVGDVGPARRTLLGLLINIGSTLGTGQQFDIGLVVGQIEQIVILRRLGPIVGPVGIRHALMAPEQRLIADV